MYSMCFIHLQITVIMKEKYKTIKHLFTFYASAPNCIPLKLHFYTVLSATNVCVINQSNLRIQSI